MATTGGNLMQRTRCSVLLRHRHALQQARARDAAARPSTGSTAYHAILGTSEHCIATHPSDMCVALAALEAVVRVTGPGGDRSIPFAEFHRLPGDTPHLDTNLRRRRDHHGGRPARRGLRRAPRLPEGPRPHVLRLRPGLGRRRAARWTATRSRRPASRWAAWPTSPGATRQAEALLRGAEPPRGTTSGGSAEAILRDARGFGHNNFKIELARRAIVRALSRGRRRGGTPMTTAHIGKPISRVDGRAKVTGEAKYAAEYHVPDLAYGWVVSSAIARGKIIAIDAAEALELPGVLQVFTHENTPGLAWFDRSYRDEVAPPGSPFRPLHDAEIQFSAQPVALVVADTLRAGALRRDARPGRVRTRSRTPRTWRPTLETAYKPKERDGHQAAAEAARPRRQGPRRGRRAGRRGVPRAGRAPQPDGDVRDDRGPGRGRHAHRLRQDAGRAERPRLPLQRVRLLQGRAARRLAVSSAGRSARGCARSTRSSWPSWRRAS